MSLRGTIPLTTAVLLGLFGAVHPRWYLPLPPTVSHRKTRRLNTKEVFQAASLLSESLQTIPPEHFELFVVNPAAPEMISFALSLKQMLEGAGWTSDVIESISDSISLSNVQIVAPYRSAAVNFVLIGRVRQATRPTSFRRPRH
jgi:hypothetical protein